MARYCATVPSTLPAPQAFDLLANFDSVQEWDPTVPQAERLDQGDLGVGSVFRVVVAFGPRKMPLTYVVREFEPEQRVRLEAVTELFTSDDVITVVPTPLGSTVTYDANLIMHGPARPADPLVQAAFRVLGKGAEAGLQRVLNP
jgi:hypothetical protein